MGRSDLHDHLFELLARDGRLVAHLGPVVIDGRKRTAQERSDLHAVGDAQTQQGAAGAQPGATHANDDGTVEVNDADFNVEDDKNKQ